MIDRLFSVVLTFAVLIGSTLAIGSEMLAPRAGGDRTSAVQVLPRVVITGEVKRDAVLAQNAAGTFVR